MRRDQLNRLQFKLPTTGSLFVRNRAHRYHDATAQMHVNDLSTTITDVVKPSGKRGVCLLVDGGPDYSVKSLLTILKFGRLWRHQDLDLLLMGPHAPGDSAYNCIEHAWSPLSKFLSGVALPLFLPEDADDVAQPEAFDKAPADLDS